MAASRSTQLPIAERIRARLTDLKISEREASRRAGFGLSYVGDVIHGRSKEPAMPRMIKLAEALECDIDYLMGIEIKPKRPAERRSFSDTLTNHTSPPRLINLFTARVTSESEFGVMIPLPIDRVAAPPALEHVVEAYAFAVHTDLMEPRYYVGETVFIDPGKPVRPGDFIFIKLTDGQIGITRFVEQRGEKTVIEFLNFKPGWRSVTERLGMEIEGDSRVVHKPGAVEYMHRIVGSAG